MVQDGYLDPSTLDRIFGDVGDILLELLEGIFDDEGARGGFAASIVDKVTTPHTGLPETYWARGSFRC